MTKSDKAAVVIPIYKAWLTEPERASLRQAFKILGGYNIFFITFKKLDTGQYRESIPGKDYLFVYFDQHYFESIAGYNELMLSRRFYRVFTEFEYLLIYQLDAWVFKDELSDWCRSGYDYIGAPWFSSDCPIDSLPHFLGVGNGGFSLRKVKSHLHILSKFSYIISPNWFINKFFKHRTWKSFINVIKSFTIENNTYDRLGKNNMYEDRFWNSAAGKFSWFKVPDMLTASRFSVESNPRKLYTLHNNALPFGCHAWQTYEPEFWKHHISV